MNPIIANTFRLAVPFWRDAPQRHAACLLALVLVAVAATSTGLNAWLNHLNKAFYDALQNLDARAFNQSVMMIFAVVGFLAAMTLGTYLRQGPRDQVAPAPDRHDDAALACRVTPSTASNATELATIRISGCQRTLANTSG